MNQTASRTPPAARALAGPPRAGEVADVLIASLVAHDATAVWFEPMADDELHQEAHRVTLERGRRQVVSAVLGGGLGDAVLARLALLAELDLLAGRPRSGRCAVRCDGRVLDLLVTVRGTDRGLAGELRRLDAAGDEAGATVASLPSGEAYPEILAPGTTVGPYRIERTLGRGGMGVVYAAEHTLLRKRFAMKVLAPSVLAEDPDSARRFVREARAAARVAHPGIVDVSDFGSLSDGRHYLVMELLSGRSLGALLDADGPLPPARAIAIVRGIASALGAAHAAGVVHRDLSPSNVFVDVGGEPDRVKLVDFGAAKVPDPDQADVPDGPAGYVLGTPYYMAPEQAQALQTDGRADLYALGVIFFELVSGAVPFDGDTPLDIVLEHIRQAPPALTSPAEALPDGLERIVARLLAKAPEDRYQTASALIDDLDRVASHMNRRGWRRWLPA